MQFLNGDLMLITAEKLLLVSIIIPCHNYARYLAESITSALSQTYPNIEVIVIDDESTDNTTEIARRFPVKYVRIKHQGFLTPAHAHNIGLKLCHGEFVIFFGADDRLKPTYVEQCYKTLMYQVTRNNAIGFVWTGTQEFGDSEMVRLPRLRELVHWYHAFTNIGGQIGAILVPLSVYKVVGGYDEKLHCFEDRDWIIRALSKGFKGVSINESLHEYRFHSNNLTKGKVTVNTESELWLKYPWMKQYAFMKNRFDELTLFFTGNRLFRIKFYNRIMKFFHSSRLKEEPCNSQNVLGNEL
jgi:glycosyltransferase involved in cell wall biosynthesis